MNRAAGLVIFAFGAAIGSVVTWQYVKQKYEQIAQEEIDSVKEAFSKKKLDIVDSANEDLRAKADKAKEKDDLAKYAGEIKKQGYINYSDLGGEKPKIEEGDLMTTFKPYVISPDSFGEFDDYDKISLTFYADQILTDEDDHPIEDVEGSVGFDSLGTFGEYEDDSVFVRNDRLKVDYEILLDQRNYSDVVKTKPREVN